MNIFNEVVSIISNPTAYIEIRKSTFIVRAIKIEMFVSWSQFYRISTEMFSIYRQRRQTYLGKNKHYFFYIICSYKYLFKFITSPVA